MHQFFINEFWKCIGLILTDPCFVIEGKNMWFKDDPPQKYSEYKRKGGCRVIWR